jgi:benzodiazapine receptor
MFKISKPSHNIRSSHSSPWWMALVFAGGVFALGMGVAGVAFARRSTKGAKALDAYNFPGTSSSTPFWLVWFIIYPCMGVATWLVWRRRNMVRVQEPLLIFAVSLVQGFTFWLSQSVRMTQIIDGTGLMLAYSTAWIYSRYSKAAALWLIPWLLWMPFTFILKLGWLNRFFH